MPSAKIELRTALPQDEPALRENWRECFGDEDAYLDFFFSRRFVPEDTPVVESDGKVVSQLFLLPAALCAGAQRFPAYYLFAAATHPAYRGRGLMRTLLGEAERLSRIRGQFAVVLLPGEESLYRYYARCGYEAVFTRRSWRISRQELSAYGRSVKRTDALPVLDKLFSARDGLLWDANALRYALDEYRLFRGEYAASDNVFVCVSGEDAECICTPDRFPEALGLLSELSDRPELCLRFPADIPFGTPEKGGMIRYLTERIELRNAYVSFSME